MKPIVTLTSAALSIFAFAVGVRANVTVMDVCQGTAPAGSVVYTNTFGTLGSPASTDLTGSFAVTGLNSSNAYSGSFAVTNGYGTAGTSYPVTLVNFVGYTSGPAIYSAATDMYYVNLVGWKGTFQAVSAVNGASNCLTFDYSSAVTTGSDHYNGTLSWNNGDTTLGVNISFRTLGTSTDFASVFSSDFLDYSNPNSLGAFYVRESMTGTLSASNPIIVNANGTVQSFTADPTFEFSSDPQPPAKTP